MLEKSRQKGQKVGQKLRMQLYFSICLHLKPNQHVI